MARSRTIIIAGAGIGGLTAALTLARAGFRAVVLEQAARLEDGRRRHPALAQCDARAARSWLLDRLRPHAVAPEAIRIIEAAPARDIVACRSARTAERVWRALLGDPSRRPAGRAARSRRSRAPTSPCGSARAWRTSRSTSTASRCKRATAQGLRDEQGIALVGADGLWSTLRARLGDRRPPRFAHRTAWRAIVPAERG